MQTTSAPTARSVTVNLGMGRTLQVWWAHEPGARIREAWAQTTQPGVYSGPLRLDLYGTPSPGHRRRAIATVGPDGWPPVTLKWTIEDDTTPVREIEMGYEQDGRTHWQLIALYDEAGLTQEPVGLPKRWTARP